MQCSSLGMQIIRATASGIEHLRVPQWRERKIRWEKDRDKKREKENLWAGPKNRRISSTRRSNTLVEKIGCGLYRVHCVLYAEISSRGKFNGAACWHRVHTHRESPMFRGSSHSSLESWIKFELGLNGTLTISNPSKETNRYDVMIHLVTSCRCWYFGTFISNQRERERGEILFCWVVVKHYPGL